MPQVILAMDFPLTVAVYDVAALVTEGIALNDLPAFLDTAAGQSWTPEHSLMFTLRPHSAVFIPAGFIAIIAYLNSDAGPSQPLLANAMVWTVFSTALAKDCDRNAWQAVVNFNNRFLATVAQDRIFGARADLSLLSLRPRGRASSADSWGASHTSAWWRASAATLRWRPKLSSR